MRVGTDGLLPSNYRSDGLGMELMRLMRMNIDQTYVDLR
jgi:hypothetical protein